MKIAESFVTRDDFPHRPWQVYPSVINVWGRISEQAHKQGKKTKKIRYVAFAINAEQVVMMTRVRPEYRLSN